MDAKHARELGAQAIGSDFAALALETSRLHDARALRQLERGLTHGVEEVHEGLRKIGREEAEVIRLKHFEGQTFEEISRHLGLSPNTVKTRYYRGLEELRPLLTAREDAKGARG